MKSQKPSSDVVMHCFTCLYESFGRERAPCSLCRDQSEWKGKIGQGPVRGPSFLWMLEDHMGECYLYFDDTEDQQQEARKNAELIAMETGKPVALFRCVLVAECTAKTEWKEYAERRTP